jgi:hypothetical protein
VFWTLLLDPLPLTCVRQWLNEGRKEEGTIYIFIDDVKTIGPLSVVKHNLPIELNNERNRVGVVADDGCRGSCSMSIKSFH